MHTILVTTPKLAPEGHARLIASGARVLYVGAADPAGDLRRLLGSEPIDGIISRTLPLSAELIALCPGLKAISRHGVGYDSVDIEAAAARGIPVSIAAGTNAQSVAELAIALMFAVARSVGPLDQAIRAGGWPRAGAGLQLSGKRLGLVGYGRIARMVGTMARAIGMEIRTFDPALSEEPGDAIRVTSLAALLAQSDVISLHCPLTEATRNLLDTAALAALPRGAIVINTARGGLIDEAALALALAEGRLAGAGLDTLAQEPPAADNPLLVRPEVLLTPHVGGSTDAALAGTAISAADNLLAMLDGRPVDPALIVNRHLMTRKETT